MYYFSHARTALKYGLLNLGISKSNKVLVPDFICDSLIHPLIQLGINIIYYKINENFKPEWADVENKLNSHNISAIIMVNYFGQVQDLQKFISVKNKHNIFLIEDNSHGLNKHNHYKNIEIDFSITSPRKFLNIASGGILYIESKININLPIYNSNIITTTLKKVIKNSRKIQFFINFLIKNIPNFEKINYLKEKNVNDFLIDKNSMKILNHILNNKYNVIRENRRKQWIYWEKIAIEFGGKLIFDEVQFNNIPWALPIIFEDIKQKNNFIAHGKNKFINFFPWPVLPYIQISSNAGVRKFWYKIVCIPLYNIDINK